MAGGTFKAQNKVRPGAYISFVPIPQPRMTLGARGIVTLPMALDWGAEGELINIYSTELLTDASIKKVGFSAFDAQAKVLTAALSNAYLAKVFRINFGGAKAAGDIIGNAVSAEAKYNGEFGNKIRIVVSPSGDMFIVETWVNEIMRDSQRVSRAPEISNNDFVNFTVSDSEAALTETIVILDGGSNGDVTEPAAWAAYNGLAKNERWQTMAVLTDNMSVKSNQQTFVKNMRYEQGNYVQAVIPEYDAANDRAVINSVQAVNVDGTNYSVVEYAAYIAGLTAGSEVTQSNTGHIIPGGTVITSELDNEGIIAALKAGKLVHSHNQDGSIKIEQDINSLHTFNEENSYPFSKNRVLRVLDEIGTSTRNMWESMYMGKVSNDDTGRALFEADIIAYLRSLQDIGAIQNFMGDADVTVEAGNDIDAVAVSLWIQPVDSMEKLYMTVNVIG